MSKYIIELGEEANMVQAINVTQNGNVYVNAKYVTELKELTSDYINEHYGQLQQDAYDKGYKDGRNVTETQAHNDAYQRGLDDAWECGKKLAWTAKYGGYGERLNDVFGRDDTFDFYDYTPHEAIAKLKSYEEKQSDKIEVGDEVEWDNDFTGDRFIVTRIYQPYGKKEQCDGIDDDGYVYHDVLINDLEKTGRHFDIASILEAMRE